MVHINRRAAEQPERRVCSRERGGEWGERGEEQAEVEAEDRR